MSEAQMGHLRKEDFCFLRSGECYMEVDISSTL